jgi:hypothetical protein
MIVRSGDGSLVFSAEHQGGDSYQVCIERVGVAKITGEFNQEELTCIIEGLTEAIIANIVNNEGGQ